MNNILPIILAAGESKRMRSAQPKPLLPLLGKPLLQWILDSLKGVPGLQKPVLVVGHGADTVSKAFGPVADAVLQEPRLGTGHALLQCLPTIDARKADTLLVLCGDAPLIRTETIQALIHTKSDAAVLAFEPANPHGYGRVILNKAGFLDRIVEEKDASATEKSVGLVNSGMYLLPVKGLAQRLKALGQNNSQGEYYLTEVPRAMAQEGLSVAVVKAQDSLEAEGVNTPRQLASMTQALRHRIIDMHLEAGVHIEDPSLTFIEADVEIAPGARILPFTVIRRGVKVGTACEVGPFSHLRPGTRLSEGAEVGNFTEVKNSSFGVHTKAKHLSYIGDATLGRDVNIGAGTVFCNFDGKHKHETHIGDGSFIGSGTLLVAPVKVGRGSKTGAGAVVAARRDVDDGVTVVGVPARPVVPKEGRS
ncbi:MAG: bifunctional N-acetylglucosamine-1-phosphate uridyltransferase/glucosamine-1-phosphate acetyltransferase [Planctomycetota bacterium]